MSNRNVSPLRPRTKDEVSDALAADWVRLAPMGKRAAFSMRIGADEDGKTVSKAISGEHLPAAHTVLNSLCVDDGALFNVLLLYGGVFVPVDPDRTADMDLISQLLHAATEAVDRKKDGHWCPSDKAALAKLFKPLVPALLAIIQDVSGHEPPATLKAVA